MGGDGFGFAFDMEGDGSGPRHFKVPQSGIAELEDDVELGANTCVDRATLGETVVRRGAKIDNLVQIAHNVDVGPLSLIAAQVGISGSTKVGMGVVLGARSGSSATSPSATGPGSRRAVGGAQRHPAPARPTPATRPTAHRDWLREVGRDPRAPGAA